MTGRLFVLWLIDGALAIMVASGGLFVLIAGLLLFLAFDIAPAASRRDMAMIALAHFWEWSGFAAMLSMAAWLFLHSLASAFYGQHAGEQPPAPFKRGGR